MFTIAEKLSTKAKMTKIAHMSSWPNCINSCHTVNTLLKVKIKAFLVKFVQWGVKHITHLKFYTKVTISPTINDDVPHIYLYLDIYFTHVARHSAALRHIPHAPHGFATHLTFLVPLMAFAWCRHQKVTVSALLALCAGNSPVSVEFPSHRPVTRSFDVFFDLCLE